MFIKPMQPSLAKPFSHPDWVFEPKWDGYRALLSKGRLTSRRQVDLTKRFPEIRIEQDVLIDGELVALDSNGLPCFEGLRSKRLNCLILYYAFDLLYLEGEDLRNLPLLKRKRILKRIIPKTGRIKYTEHFTNGAKLFQHLEELRLEGMVAKKKNSVYVSGRTRDWLKIKTAYGREEMRKRSEAWQR